MDRPTPNNRSRTTDGRDLSPQPSLQSFASDDDSTPEVDISIDEPEPNMPPNRRGQPFKREADISLILNPAQRSDFTTLVDAILDRINAQTTTSFDYLHLPAAQKNRVQVWDYGDAISWDTDFTTANPTKIGPSGKLDDGADNTTTTSKDQLDDAQVTSDQGDDSSNWEDNANSEVDPNGEPRDPRPVSSPPRIAKIDVNTVQGAASAMSELQKEVNGYFNKWKSTFLKRFNDLVVPNLASNSNAGPPRQGPGPPRGGGGGGGGGPAGRPQQQPQQVNRGTPYQADLNLIRRFPPTPTPLTTLPVDKRRLLLHTMILLLMSTEHYISYSRILLLNLASSLHIPMYALVEDEQRVARGLGKVYKTMCEESEKREAEETKKKAQEERRMAENSKPENKEASDTASNEEAQMIRETKQGQGAKPAKETKPPKKWRPSTNPFQVGTSLLAVGLGSVPAAQGLPAISLPPVTVASLLGPLGDMEAAVGMFFGVNPNRPTGKSFDVIAHSLQDCALIQVHGSNLTETWDPKDVAAEDRRMRIVLCVNGLHTDTDNVVSPWKSLGPQNEVYALRWETEALKKIGDALYTLVKSKVWGISVGELSGRPIMTTMHERSWPTHLLRVSKIVDNAWIMGMMRSTKLSQVLSDTVMSHNHGERGVSLIGYGLGARAVYLCLAYLAERRIYGLVDTAILMGAPIPSDAGTWSALKSVVTGRLVNVYSETDYMMAFASRMTAYQFGVAGLSRIEGVGGVENCDVSDILSAHLYYPSLVGDILKRIGWEDLKIAPPRAPVQTSGPAQKATVAPSKRPAQAPVAQAKENKDSTQRGGGKNARSNNNNDKPLAGQMGRMSLK